MHTILKTLTILTLGLLLSSPISVFAAPTGFQNGLITYPYNGQYDLLAVSWSQKAGANVQAYITTVNESVLTGETNIISKNSRLTKNFYVVDDLKPSTRYIIRIITQNESNQPVWVEKVIKTPTRFDIGSTKLQTQSSNPAPKQSAAERTRIIYKQTPADRLSYFIGHGVDSNTTKMGIGERSAVVKSFEFAFKRIPSADADVDDVIRLANGDEPLQKNVVAEKRAKEHFRYVYQRIPDMRIPADKKAIMIMAYGMRQHANDRSDVKERIAMTRYKNLYNQVPAATEDWNILQAIAYSGVIGYKDTDGDYLPDYWEYELGTDVFNKDTDGDGYLDGVEVMNGYNAK